MNATTKHNPSCNVSARSIRRIVKQVISLATAPRKTPIDFRKLGGEEKYWPH